MICIVYVLYALFTDKNGNDHSYLGSHELKMVEMISAWVPGWLHGTEPHAKLEPSLWTIMWKSSKLLYSLSSWILLLSLCHSSLFFLSNIFILWMFGGVKISRSQSYDPNITPYNSNTLNHLLSQTSKDWEKDCSLGILGSPMQSQPGGSVSTVSRKFCYLVDMI